MKIAIVVFTLNGKQISSKIKDRLYGTICHEYVFFKYASKNEQSFGNGKELMKNIFHKYDYIVFVGACGIAVRLISPYVKDKTKDPGIVVLDELGRYAISLLSGHIGGANELAYKLASITGAEPVVTTATDIGGKFSPDSFAMENNLYISDISIAKAVATEILSGKKIGLYTDYKCYNIPEKYIQIYKDTKAECVDVGICISSDITMKPFKTTLNLVPKNMIIGVGCRRNIDTRKFEDYILNVLDKYKIPIQSVCMIASIDLKKNEDAILCFAKKYDLKFVTFTTDELNELKGDFTPSEFVRNTTGVDNVCERSALKCGNELLIKKIAGDGVTMAVARKDFDVDFLRKSRFSGMEE